MKTKKFALFLIFDNYTRRYMCSGHDYKVSVKIIPILPWVSIAVDIVHECRVDILLGR